MILRQTFSRAIGGYWNGGPKSVFDWGIDGHEGQDKKGTFIRVGSWTANHWFHVAKGKTDKQTLSNARRRLQASARKSNIECSFEYINKEEVISNEKDRIIISL